MTILATTISKIFVFTLILFVFYWINKYSSLWIFNLLKNIFIHMIRLPMKIIINIKERIKGIVYVARFNRRK